MRLLLANFLNIECCHVLYTHVRHWHASDTAGSYAYYGEIIWHTARQIQIKQRLSFSIVYNKQLAWTSGP